MSFLFYDLETTGLDRAFDQILRFGSVRTDDDLEEIDRTEIRVRLREDVVPAPDALLTHRIGVEAARSEGLTELEAVRRIHELVNEPGTTSVGYNSLGFDDEFLRFSFYRNLLPPYTHQWKNGCGRMDLYPMAVAYYLAGSDVVEWPREEERVRLRLEDLDAANDLSDGRAHSAMGDAAASWSLARRFRRERELWDRLVRHFDKRWDEGNYERLPAFGVGRADYRVGLLVGGSFGWDRGFRRPVLALGRHRVYSNQTRWLALDGGRFEEWGEEGVEEEASVYTKKFGQPDLLFGVGRDELVGLEPERRGLANENLKWLRSRPELLERLADRYAGEAYDEVADVDVDAGLYVGEFWSDRSRRRCQAFHEASGPGEMWASASRFEREDLRALAERVLFRNFAPTTLPEEVREAALAYGRRVRGEGGEVIRDFRDRVRRTPSEALAAIEERRESVTGAEDRRLLEELEAYLRSTFLS